MDKCMFNAYNDTFKYNKLLSNFIMLLTHIDII